MTVSKEIITKASDELSEDRMVKVLDLIRCLRKSAIGKVLAVTFSALLLFSLIVPTAPAQEATDHIVISEVEIKDSEWVELYNPTDSDVDMSNWYWCYFSSTKTSWSDPHRERIFS